MLEAERRIAKRVEFREPIQYRSLDSEKVQGSLGYDLSETGVRFQTEDFVPLNKNLALHMDLGSGASLDMSGQVVWVQVVPHADRYQVGVNFENSDVIKNSKKIIQQFVNSRPV